MKNIYITMAKNRFCQDYDIKNFDTIDESQEARYRGYLIGEINSLRNSLRGVLFAQHPNPRSKLRNIWRNISEQLQRVRTAPVEQLYKILDDLLKIETEILKNNIMTNIDFKFKIAEAGYSLQKFAKKIGKSESYIYKISSGVIPLSKELKIEVLKLGK